MFTARERLNQFTPNLACLFRETRKRFENGQNPKTVLSLSSGEDGFCSSESKRCRRTAPRPKLVVSMTGLQDRRRNSGKHLSWVLVPVKVVTVAR
jgi:hypothetical protein